MLLFELLVMNNKILNIMFIGELLNENYNLIDLLSDSQIKTNVFFHPTIQEAANHFNTTKQQPPDIILLDITSPSIKGIDFLEFRKSNKACSLSPCVILSSTNNVDLKDLYYKYPIAGYIIKPDDSLNISKMVSIIIGYWSKSEFTKENIL